MSVAYPGGYEGKAAPTPQTPILHFSPLHFTCGTYMLDYLSPLNENPGSAPECIPDIHKLI